MLWHGVLRGDTSYNFQRVGEKDWSSDKDNLEGFAAFTPGKFLKQKAWLFIFSVTYGLIPNFGVCQVAMAPGLRYKVS